MGFSWPRRATRAAPDTPGAGRSGSRIDPTDYSRRSRMCSPRRSCSSAPGDPTAAARVMVATPLDSLLVERVAAVDARVEVLFDPALLPPERFPSDHKGD